MAATWKIPSLRQVAPFALAFVVVTAVVLLGPAIDPGLSTFWHRTVVSQATRDSPFSIWGQTSLGGLHVAVEALTVAFAIAIAFVPRWRSLRQVAALGAAAMIAVELCLDHWFYLYIPWFFPLLVLALALGPEVRVRREEETEQSGEVETQPVAAASA